MSSQARPISYIQNGECWVQTSHTKDKDGYGVLKRWGRKIAMHRYIALVEFGCPIDMPSTTYYVRLLCGRADCINPQHLYFTKDTNNWSNTETMHLIDHNQKVKKLSSIEVREVKNLLLQNTLSYENIAKIFNISTSTISNINQGRIWHDDSTKYPIRKKPKKDFLLYRFFYKGEEIETYVRSSVKYRVNKKGEVVGRLCKQCNTWKPTPSFSKRVLSSCSSCTKEYQKTYRLENAEKLKRSQGDYYKSNMKKINSRNREYRRKNWLEVKRSIALWHLKNPHKKHTYYVTREKYKALLPWTLSTKQYEEKVLPCFNYRCALTGAKADIHLEHFIPNGIGHGGTTVGNCYPLNGSLNSSKRATNPFEWVKRENIQDTIQKEMWENLIEYLSSANNLSKKDYERYVYWCFDNPRTIEDLRRDNTPSIELWQRSREEINNE